ncbi:glucan endo-1,3-beta-glucosidase 3-like isoform X1 [Musa acuminata AAA Group]|uniref:glucan endo-1,3-beta-glucosidase 3-like isoform X1 n=1 Tax=Musa acuminata AAA Group TaxID=214697 RepID=UPI0031D24D31
MMGEDNVPQPQSSACIRCLPILMCSPTSSPRHPSPLLPPPHSLSLPLLLKSLSRSGSRTKMWSFWAAVAPPPHAFRRKRVKSMALRLLFLFLSLSAIYADEGAYIGVNVGTALSNMPSPTMVAALLKSQQIRNVRLYDADPAMLAALTNTGIRVTVSVPNEQLLAVGQSNATAANWVARNVVAHVPAVNITAIAVGSEVLTALPNAAPLLVPALRYIHSALVAANLDGVIKVSTPHSSSLILDSFPPSQAFFNRTLEPVFVPMLKFLQSTGSYLMLNVYPYYDYLQSNGIIPLDYALFRPLPPNKEAVDANTLLHYTNVFDAVVDAAYFAMAYLNVTNLPVVVMESGWPHKGDPTTEPDATTDNANTYNSNLIRHVINSTGTPKHPGVSVPTYIYELYDEDLRPGVTSEKFWGLFDANGVPAYTLHLTGSGMLLANDTSSQTFCVAKEGADEKLLQAGIDWACGPGKVDCSLLTQGKPCYDPDTVEAHASYAFNEYYHGMGMAVGTCHFSGVAAITTTDPSHDSCLFSGSGGRNGTVLNGTSLATSPNSTSSTSSDAHSFYQSKVVLQIVEALLSGLVFL